MRIDAIKIGNNPPDDVNVIIEVPIGGEIRVGQSRRNSGRRSLPTHADALSRQLWFRAAHVIE
jgi:hypothetical protein